MRRKSSEPLTPAEWKVMRAVWELGGGTSRDVHEIAGELHGWAPNTVRTILTHLVDKGFLAAEEVGNRYIYKPTKPAVEVLKSAADALLEKNLESTKGEILCYLVAKSNLSPQDIEELRALLDEYDRQTGVAK